MILYDNALFGEFIIWGVFERKAVERFVFINKDIFFI